MRPDPRAEGPRWLRQAEHDQSDAEYALAGSRYSLVCFLSQQAGEKALSMRATPTEPWGSSAR